jgi:hypothetical protein
MISDEQLAAKLYHIIEPKKNFYKMGGETYRKWLNIVRELKEQGIIKND